MPVAPESSQTDSVIARSRGPALFWRVAIGNAAVLAAACTITALVFSPSVEDVAVRELAIFAGGLVLMLALNLLLLRHALAPLRELTAFARRIDLLEPGRRLEIGGGESEAAGEDRELTQREVGHGGREDQRRDRARRGEHGCVADRNAPEEGGTPGASEHGLQCEGQRSRAPPARQPKRARGGLAAGTPPVNRPLVPVGPTSMSHSEGLRPDRGASIGGNP